MHIGLFFFLQDDRATRHASIHVLGDESGPKKIERERGRKEIRFAVRLSSSLLSISATILSEEEFYERLFLRSQLGASGRF